uniref:Tektin n=1 Tax=Loa loa TaxID=7209 RepID=A0A1I7W287_LOALO
MSGNYPTLAAEMLQQRNDVIARRDSRLGQLLVAPCKTNGITLKNIEFSGGLKGKFEIERINAELELEGQQLANQLVKELDQVEDSIQEKLKKHSESLEINNHVHRYSDYINRINHYQVEIRII